MFENNARMLRDTFLVLALVIFLAGIIDILMLAFDFSFRTRMMVMLGAKPHSFAEAAIFCTLIAIAFGIIELNREIRR